jgi:Type VI secretion system/phage-baseplate injector OB domain
MSSPAHDWPFVAPDQEDEKDPKRFYGVSTATVIDPLDPLFLGRVQVQLPFVDFLDLSPWARIAVPMAGQFSGFYCLPKVGDEVLVAFEHGDINVPYVIGSLWNGFSPPPLPTPLAEIRTIRSPLGNQLVFTEVPPTLVLQNGPTPPEVIPAPPVPAAYQSLVLSPAGMVTMATNYTVTATLAMNFIVGSNVVTINPSGVTITSAGELTLSAASGINIVAGGTVNIVGALVTINP